MLYHFPTILDALIQDDRNKSLHAKQYIYTIIM